jgi:peroxiredoxin family protein
MPEERKLGIVFASGAANRICCLVVYGAAALAAGYRVVVHLVNEGLVAFRKDVLPRLNTQDLGVTMGPQIYVPYIETYLRNLKSAVEKGEFKDWYSS